MNKTILKNASDWKKIAEEFNTNYVTVRKALNNETPNSLQAYKMREWAKANIGAIDVEFKED